MVEHVLAMALAFSSGGLQRPPSSPRPQFDAFEVATIKPVDADGERGRFIIMRGKDTFVGKNYTLKLLIAAAYELNPREISGGPEWVESDHFDILARTPGTVQPTHDEQMRMLRNLLANRFKLSFHRQQKVFSIYELDVDKGGSKLKASKAAADAPPAVISTVYPGHILMPARNVSMADFVSVLQRAVLDRPVVDKTGLQGRYDFDLQWAPDETQFGGEIPVAPPDASSPPFFTAVREQLGLRLVATRGPADVLVIDHVEKPSPN
ncbi:MAG TPA: TIGR03435 family protein [Terracidiphilus sp.]